MSKLEEIIRNDCVPKAEDGRITFDGAVNEYTKYFLNDEDRNTWEVHVPKNYTEVFRRRWKKEATYDPNCSIYVKIHEKLPDRHIPLAEFDSDFILNIINGFQFVDGEKVLGDSTIEGYKSSFWKIYKTASVNEPFLDRLRWDEKGILENTKKRSELEIRKDKMFLLKRSFSFKEEKRLAEWFLSELRNPEKADGKVYGLLLMFCLGLRNSEAAGVDFSCFRAIPGKGFYCIYIVKTMDEKTQETKTGGKSYNVFRKIPIFPALTDILEKRFSAIVKYIIKKHHVSEKKARAKALSYKIACDGINFSKNIDRDDLTLKGKEVLEDLCITDAKQEISINEDFSQRLRENEIEEKDPTTYIFRRNAATHYYNLNLSSVSQLEYLLGHVIEDDQERRSFFVNDDRTEEIYKIMLNHPLNLLLGSTSGTSKQSITIAPSSRINTVYVSIAAKEPGEGIDIETERPELINYLSSNVFRPEGYRDTVDVTSCVNEHYMSLMNTDYPSTGEEADQDIILQGDEGEAEEYY